MAITKEILERVFEINGEKIQDTNPALSPVQVKKLLAETRPEIMNGTLMAPKHEKGKIVYVISRAAGTKG